MKITSKVLALVIMVVLFGGIMFTTAMGWWATETTKQVATFTEGEFAGQPNPADIRGSYTFGDVEKNFGIPATLMAQAFVVPEGTDPVVFGVKDLETLYLDKTPEGTEIGTSSVRWFVALYTGLPYETSEETWLPRQAVDILLALGTLTPEQVELVTERAIDLGEAPVESATRLPDAVITPIPGSEATATEHVVPDRTMRGKTTFQELLDWGLTADQIAAVLGAPMPSPTMLVKDYCTSKGIEYVAIKDALQVLLDALP